MKNKLLVICILGVMAIIFIYYGTINNKVRLLSLGDGFASGMTAYNVNGYSYADYLKDYYKKENNLENYNNIFPEANLTSEQLYNNIKKNIKKSYNSKNIAIQQAIKEANVIIISVGLDELSSKSLYNKVTSKDLNNYYSNINNILKIIRKINNEKVILLGLYQAYNIKEVDKINKNLNKLAISNNCEFLDVSKTIVNEEYFFNNTSYYLNYKGHKKVNEELIKLI